MLEVATTTPTMTLAGSAIKNEAKANQYLTSYTVVDVEPAAAVVEAPMAGVAGVVCGTALTSIVLGLLEGKGDGKPKPGRLIVNHSVCSASHIAFTARLRSSTNACAAISIAC
jgi:hypothetical protein